MKNNFFSKLGQINIFLFDLEGVLFNKKEITEQRFIKIIESFAVEFKNLGLIFGIITAAEENDLIRKLNLIDNCFIFSSSLDKVSAADKFITSHNVDYKNVFYMGDGILDVPLLKKCGVSSTPPTARREVKRTVSFITKSNNCEEILNEILLLYRKSQEVINRATK